MPRRTKDDDTKDARTPVEAVSDSLKAVMSKLDSLSDYPPPEPPPQPTEEEVKASRRYVRADIVQRVFGSVDAVTQHGVAVTAPKTTNFPADAVIDTMLEDQLCDLGLILTMYCQARDQILAEEPIDLARLQDVHLGIQAERSYRDQILAIISLHRTTGPHPAVQEALQQRADKLAVPAGPPDPAGAVKAYEGDYGREGENVDEQA